MTQRASAPAPEVGPKAFGIVPSERVVELRDRIRGFMDEHVYPNEVAAAQVISEVGQGAPYPELVRKLRELARSTGLWNLFLPDPVRGAGLTNWEYGLLCEEMGRSPLGPLVFNCSAPDTGNVEILQEHGTPEQQQRWLDPLLAGDIRSCFAMTEPDVSGSDPTAIQTRAVLDGNEWVIDGTKWFTTGALGADLAIVMCITEPEAPQHVRASMLLVPTDTPGYERVRQISVMGNPAAESEVRFTGCRVPAANVLGARGRGFVIAQNRLGPGRIHHCMRALGTAERAIELMCRRANRRASFGSKLAEFQFVQDFVFRSRVEVDQARLLTLHAAAKMDAAGTKAARQEISMAKVVVANVVMDVVDRAIQVHGALGISDDTPLGALWRGSRFLRIADGPDEVHKAVVARHELQRWADADTT